MSSSPRKSSDCVCRPSSSAKNHDDAAWRPNLLWLPNGTGSLFRAHSVGFGLHVVSQSTSNSRDGCDNSRRLRSEEVALVRIAPPARRLGRTTVSEMLILYLHTFYRMFSSPNDSSTCRRHHIFLFAQRGTQRFQTEVTRNGSGDVRQDIFHPFSYVSSGEGVGSPLGKHAWGRLLPPCKSSDWSANQAVCNLVDILMD